MGETSVLLVDNFYPRIRKGVIIADSRAVIRTPVIDENHLDIAQRLAKDTVNAAAKFFFDLIDWNNFAYKRHKQPPFISCPQAQRPS